jgi:hypothetical protein
MSTSAKAASRGQETAAAAAKRQALRQAKEARAAANGSNSGLRETKRFSATGEFHYMGEARAMILRAGERAADDEPLEAMPKLAALRETVEQAHIIAIAGYRQAGLSWAYIGEALELTRQAVQNRYQQAVEEYLAAMTEEEAS